MIDWYLKVVRDNYANFSGRARRSEYWWYTLCNILIGLVLQVLDYFIGFDIGILGSLYSLAVFIPGLAVMVRRFHDIGKSGWFVVWTGLPIFIGAVWLAVVSVTTISGGSSGALGFIVPLLLVFGGAIWLLVLVCTNGDTGVNEYGPDPKQPYDSLDEIGFKEEY
ncbi:DUF805 domain-containing protein [Flavobacterium hauense]